MKKIISNSIESSRKFRAAAVFFMLAAGFLYGMPGITQYIPDASGEYVYFRDYTFGRESYAGFLTYDNTTFEARYYAPEDKKALKPEQTIVSLFTIDPGADYVKFTGEKFLTTITPDDADVINYLHELMLDLATLRKKAGPINPDTVSLSGKTAYFIDQGLTIPQQSNVFGGAIKTTYDYLVPLFNIKKITAPDDKLLLQLVTAGGITSSADTSFLAFKGIFESAAAAPHQFLPPKDAKSVTYTYSNEDSGAKTFRQEVTLDDFWTQSMANLWLLGNNAILSMNSIVNQNGITERYLDRLTRKILLGTETSYSDLTKLRLEKTGKKISVTSTYYQYDTQNITHDIKIISHMDDRHYGYFLLTVFDNVYQAHKKYFDSIIKSYSLSKSN